MEEMAKSIELGVGNDEDNQMALYSAAERGDGVIVRSLLDIGVNVKTCQEGMRLLSTAAEGGHLEVVQVLLAKGFEPDLKDRLGQTALSLAASEGHVEIVELLLGTGKVDPDSKDHHGKTPISLAALEGYVKIVELLRGTRGVYPRK